MVNAQQDPFYSMSYYNQLSFNPASAGTKNGIMVAMNGRFQWLGVNGAPIGWTFGLDIPFIFGKTKQNCIGFGLLGMGDYVGISQSGAMKFAFNYRRIRLGPGDLSVGLDIGLATRVVSRTNWIPPMDTADPLTPGERIGTDVFDMGVGVHYSSDDFYVGVSATHINRGDLMGINHMYVNGGGFIPLGVNSKWKLNPNAVVQTDFASVYFDAGVNALCFINQDHGIIFGTSYRFIDAVGVNIGYAHQLKQGAKGIFMIGYNMDLATSRINGPGATSHELVVRFCFPSKQVKFQRIFF
jgi:type IX secretion system PorP/SprF family membrane protein